MAGRDALRAREGPSADGDLAGTRPTSVEQDCYATAYLANLTFDLAREAGAESTGEDRG